MTLTDFLLARIAEDEAIARDVGDDMMTMLSGRRVRALDYRAEEAWRLSRGEVAYSTEFSGSVEEHPARVLAECEAKRRIVAELQNAEQTAAKEWKDRAISATAAEYLRSMRVAAYALCYPYVDHPDFTNDWNPHH